MTFSFGLFSANTARAINNNISDRIYYENGADVMAEYNKLMPMLGDYYQVAPNWAEARTAWWNMLQQVGSGTDVATAVAKFVETANK